MNNKELMRRAIALSEESVKNGGGPFGAVIARNGEIVAEAANRVTLDHDPTAHAEVSAIRLASRKLGTFNLVRALSHVLRCHLLGASRQHLLCQ